MQERVIENWLTNANELSFTVPFAQVLALQGHKIIHISPKKATLEQGKDIITIDPEGSVHCYQLKGGDVTLDRWRRELKPEVEAMMDLPPRHPAVPADADWVCHLVVNGEFKGEAAREVYDTQDARVRRGLRSFEVVVRGQLLQDFSDVYGKYLPRELADFAAFIDMYREPGTEPLDKKTMAGLLNGFFASILGDVEKFPSRNEIRQQINAAMVSTGFLLTNKYKAANHVAVIDGWILLFAHVSAVAERADLPVEYSAPSVEVIELVVAEAFAELIEDIDGRTNYAEWAPVPYADAFVYKVRTTTVIGYLSAFSLYRMLRGDKAPFDDRIRSLVERSAQKDDPLIEAASEAQFAQCIIVALYAREDSLPTVARRLLLSFINALIESADSGGFYDPYTDVQDIVRSALGITLRPVKRSMGRNSYVLESLCLLAAHLGEREALTYWWRKISHFSFITVKPEESWQWYLWRIPSGKNESRFPPQEQSWSSLVQATREIDSIVPPGVIDNVRFLPLLLCVMPHRMSGYAIRTLMAALPAKPHA